jgi:hypothetical protein
MKNHLYLAFVLTFVFLATSQAQITYVDATDGVSGNTAIAPSAGGGVFNGVVPETSTPNDGLWDKRAFANNATIFQNSGTNSNVDTNAVRLATTISGLAPGTYDVYVYFWTDSARMWRIGASLSDSPGQLPLYMTDPVTGPSPGVVQYYDGPIFTTVMSSTLEPNPFTTDVMIADGNRYLLQAWLGAVTGTSFTVYIEGDRNMQSLFQRTWYDGVGYSAVPEPSTLALLVMGVLPWHRTIKRRGVSAAKVTRCRREAI